MNALVSGLHTAKVPDNGAPQFIEDADDAVLTRSVVGGDDSQTDAKTEIFELLTEFEGKQDDFVFNSSTTLSTHGTSNGSTKQNSNKDSPRSNKQIVSNDRLPALINRALDLSKNLLMNCSCPRSVSLVNEMNMLEKRLDGMTRRINEIQTDMRQIAKDFTTLFEEFISMDAAQGS